MSNMRMRHREFFIRQTRKVIGASVFPYMLATDRIPCCDALCLIFVLFTLLLFSNHNFLFIFLSPRSGDHHFHHILLFNQNLLSFFFVFSEEQSVCVLARARSHNIEPKQTLSAALSCGRARRKNVETLKAQRNCCCIPMFTEFRVCGACVRVCLFI